MPTRVTRRLSTCLQKFLWEELESPKRPLKCWHLWSLEPAHSRQALLLMHQAEERLTNQIESGTSETQFSNFAISCNKF